MRKLENGLVGLERFDKYLMFKCKGKEFFSFLNQIESGEADLALPLLACTRQRMAVAHCQVLRYDPFYFWSRYPIETTKFWNMLELMDPPSYFFTWATLTAVVVVMKIMTKYGTKLGLPSATTEILCVPFQ